MRQTISLINLLIVLFIGILGLNSCEKIDFSDYRTEGSNRDWTYSKDQVSIYIDGVKQTSVSELTVVSYHTSNEWMKEHEPYLFETKFKIKGLLKKNKTTVIEVIANLDSFIGTTVINNIKYNITGEYTGDCFDHYSKFGVIIYLEKQ